MNRRPAEPRTRERALDVLLEHLEGVRAGVQDRAAHDLLSDDLVSKVLAIAWEHQFDGHREGFLRHVQEVVETAIESHEIAE